MVCAVLALIFRAQAKLSWEILNSFKPEPSQVRILILSPSHPSPASSSSSQLGTLCIVTLDFCDHVTMTVPDLPLPDHHEDLGKDHAFPLLRRH